MNDLVQKFKEYKNIKPMEFGIKEHLRLDKTSPILNIYRDVQKQNFESIYSEQMSINGGYHSDETEHRQWNSSSQNSPKKYQRMNSEKEKEEHFIQNNLRK